ncbi:spore protease YyaC [Paenibacillus spongiae]|uniref:Spore protease YyaC n=1 Tax=Paenibacillus spongiae TaxID=2909671 RepID=A0ABY5SFX8_9BACL|nr:spore protease YyaC [Paenibacillus spongiae]UVI31647.1 spore protease YyaC [Paenibacillus spongiae]
MKSRTKPRRHSDGGAVSWQRADADGLRSFLLQAADSHPDRSSLTVVCIGTDRSTGDSFGPWIGTMLRERGWTNVIGTLSSPCDADRYERAVAGIHPEQTVIAIDACLGKPDSVGGFLVKEGQLQPAQATDKRLSPIGHYSIAGVVAPFGARSYWSLQRASLYEIIAMAGQAADALCLAWPDRKRAASDDSRDAAPLMPLLRFMMKDSR